MFKKVELITIPLYKQDWSINELLKCIITDNTQFEQVGALKLINDNNSLNSKCWQPQRLIVLANSEIQKGDFVFFKDSLFIYQATEKIGDLWKFEPIDGDPDNTVFGKKKKKIIASYPKLPNTLSISQNTIREWIYDHCPKESSVKVINESNGIPDFMKNDKGDLEIYPNVKMPTVQHKSEDEIKEMGIAYIKEKHGEGDLADLATIILSEYFIDGYKKAMKDFGIIQI